MDEFTRECLAIEVARRLRSNDVLFCLVELFVHREVPRHLHNDNGPEFAAKAVRQWLPWMGVQTVFIDPGSPWENGYVESFNDKLREELLNRELFTTLWEVQALVERWRRYYNQVQPHRALGFGPTAPEAMIPQRA